MSRAALVTLALLACRGGAPSSDPPAPTSVPAAAPTSAPAAATPMRVAVPADAGVLVTDAEAFATFARDARAALARDPGAAVTVDGRFLRALLDALDERWPDAVAQLDAIAAGATDPVERAMTGLTIRVRLVPVAADVDAALAARGIAALD